MRTLSNGFSSGFTLVEIMVAMAILSIGLLSIYTAQGNSLRASGHAERIQTAALLARQIMTEKIMEIEKGLKKGSLPDDNDEETGEFEPPFEGYRWEYKVRQVTIPLAGEAPGGEGGAPGSGGDSQAAPAAAQKNIAQIVTKKIKESVREINVIIIWEDLGEEQSVTVTTHIAKL